MLSDAQAEAILAASPGERITKESIDARIETHGFMTPPQHSSSNLTICIIKMKNGFEFVGKSACADPSNFNQELGDKYAYEDAFKQIWAHEAYLLCEARMRRKFGQ